MHFKYLELHVQVSQVLETSFLYLEELEDLVDDDIDESDDGFQPKTVTGFYL